jgi:superfamily I DNA/RNA helicase
MTTAFWIEDDQLDQDQRMAVKDLPYDGSFLLTGPAGSGKTNVLLLRAKWLTLKKKTNFKIVVFTASLKNFIERGCAQYGVDPKSVTTQMALFRSILDEYSVPYESSGDFETDRTMLAGGVKSLLDSNQLSNDYCATLLVDEAQDYTDTELLVFRGLTRRLFLIADSRQSIYKQTHTPGLLERLVQQRVDLRFHYRSGLRLCKVADAIRSSSADVVRVQDHSRYPESIVPSSVEVTRCDTFADQIQEILRNVEGQLDLYSDELIGVLFPKREQVEIFRASLASSGLPVERVWSDTMHSAKGWEFRAVHLGGCEALYRMGGVQKRLVYTALLRGKTSARLYYSGNVPGYLVEAMSVLDPPAPDPAMKDLF